MATKQKRALKYSFAWSPMGYKDKEVEAILKKVVMDPDIRDGVNTTKIAILFDHTEHKPGKRVTMGLAKKLGALLNTFIYLGQKKIMEPDDGPLFDFAVILNKQVWDAFPSDDRRAALLDHELRHCGYEYSGETRKPVIVPHSEELFARNIARYGAWTSGMQELLDAQSDAEMPLFEGRVQGPGAAVQWPGAGGQDEQGLGSGMEEDTVTLSCAGQSVTLTGEQFDEAADKLLSDEECQGNKDPIKKARKASKKACSA